MSLAHWRGVLLELVWPNSVDAIFLTLAGILLWTVRRDRNVRDCYNTLFAAVALAAALATIGKLGADVNYFLGVRMSAALAAGALVGTLWNGKAPSRLALCLASAALCSMVPSMRQLLPAAREASVKRRGPSR